MKFITTTFFILLFAIITNAQNCSDLPVNFKSYAEALTKVKSAIFLVKDSVNCSISSWIQSASYFSCDGKTGYFVLKTKEGREYIHQNMPIKVWRQFKNASSFGSYYNYNISGSYQLYIRY